MTPCSLANAQRALWGGGGVSDCRRKRRSERSDSRQTLKTDRASGGKEERQPVRQEEGEEEAEEEGEAAQGE